MKTYTIKGIEWQFAPVCGRVHLVITWQGVRVAEDMMTRPEADKLMGELREMMK